MRILLAAATAALLATSAQATTIINGSFEDGAYSGGAFDTYAAGDTNVTGWTIGLAGIDAIGSHWQASDGVRSIDLSALNQGSISQMLATTIGQDYKVFFDLAGNPDGGPPVVKQVDVAINGASLQGFTFDVTGKSNGNMGWAGQSYRFTATSTTSVLSFTSNAMTASGPALDNISIAGVPESSVWAMLIVGFGLVGAAQRRRGSAVAA